MHSVVGFTSNLNGVSSRHINSFSILLSSMKINIRSITIILFLIGRSVFAQNTELIMDSIMNERMQSGYANTHFRPDGPLDKKERRTGFWKDYEVQKGSSFQEADREPLETIGTYLFYSEGDYSQGKRTGDWSVFVIENTTDRKILSQKLTYIDGTAQGAFTYFYPDRKKAKEGNYKDGQLNGPATVYYKNGNVFGKQNYEHGMKKGMQTYYYPGGALKLSIEYKDGKANGNYEGWYENGKLKETYTFKQDSLHGRFKYYYPSGQLWTEKQYDNGRLLNVISLYDSNGKELDKGTLKDGNGLVNYYDENGNIYLKTTYHNGMEIKNETIRSVKFK